MDDSCGALDNASARRAAELMLSLLLTVCEEEEDRANRDGRESFARPRAAQTRRCFLPARRKEGKRVSGIGLLAHFFPFQTRARGSRSLSLSFTGAARARALSLLFSLLCLLREQRKALSWTPWRLRGLPRYADGRALEREREQSIE